MNKSIGGIILNVAVAAYLLATGILGISGRKFFPDGEIRKAVTAMFKGDAAEIVIVIISVLAIAAGAFIVIKFIGIQIPFGELALVVLALVWVVFIILMDFVQPFGGNKKVNMVEWLRTFGTHLMVLGGISLSTERFGG
jgi:hypothetical protein